MINLIMDDTLMNKLRATAALTIGLLVVCSNSGCTVGIKMGAQVVGSEIQAVGVREKSDKLVGRPVSAADAEFGKRIDTFHDTRSPRVLAVYPVAGDITETYRWIVESEHDRIVALGKAVRNADVGADQVKSFVLKESLIGKTSREIEQKSKFSRPLLILKRASTGRIVRVYDFTGLTDVMDARYCLIEFDSSDRMTDLRLVNVPAATERSTVRRR